MPDNINLNEKAKKDFLNYAAAVIKSRAISSVEDNLKPVHRRILYAMSELGLDSAKKPKKSARIVGDIIGKYHPHGDTSAYDAMVRLGQSWKMRYPLVEVQGNSGNILGDSPAAMRYTEAKLSPFGDLMLEGIDRGGVKFKPNYDETTTEPVLLPSIFPNILCNGNSGIAIGMATSLVPHNLKEVVNGIVAYLNFKSISLEQLMKHIPGPDFPTGGTIINSGDIAEIYRTGTGTVTLRSKYNIERIKNQDHIVITEVPYLVNIEDGIIESLKKLVVENEFDLIEDYENNTGKDGVNLRIILKKGANVYRVLDTLWKNTRLQSTQRVSNTVISNGNPVVLDLKGLIVEYVKHRHIVISNIAKFDLDKIEGRIVVLEALLKALAQIDEVIRLIKAADDKADARLKLMAFLKINEVQANAILDMKLSRLSKLDGVEIKAELGELQEKKKVLIDLIANESSREMIMKKELLNMSAKYGDARRTVLSNLTDDAAEGAPIEKVNIVMMSDGGIFTTQQDLKNLDIKRKGSLLNSSAIGVVCGAKTDETISVFTEDGSLTQLKVLTLSLENLERGLLNSAPLAAFDLNNASTLKQYILFITSGGLIKKTPTSEYLNSRNLSRTIRLKGDQTLIFVGMADDSDYVAILDEKMAYFKVSEITTTSKATIGSKGIASGRAIAAAVIGENDFLLMLNSQGQGKLTKASDFVVTTRGGVGQVVPDTVQICKKMDSYFIFDGSKNNYITANPSVKGRDSVGAKVITGTPIKISQ